MENHRALSFLVLTIGIVLPGVAGAYSRETHEGISEAVLMAYEQRRGDSFSSEEEKAIVQGGWDEDDDWRFMRHFYDPVNQIGLHGKYESSKYWAQNTEAQANYECVGAWVCYGDRVGYTDSYFSSPTDFSWDRAVYEYVWGDKIRGAAALGHVIHLLQDATVPAHVRNDAHPSKFGVTFQQDVYEGYSSKYGLGNVAVPSNISSIRFAGLGDAFDQVALYTNRNFVSRDTLSDAYQLPDFTKLHVSGGYAWSEMGYKIARVNIRFNNVNGSRIEYREILVDDEQNSVAADYWRVLSKRAIESGVGVIDLFFREVEQERQTGVLKAKNTSAAERRAKENARKGFGVVKALWGSSLNQSDVEELLADDVRQPAAAALAMGARTGPGPVVTQPASLALNPAPQQEEPVQSVNEEPSQATSIETVAPVDAVVASSSATTTQQIQSLIPVTPGFGGGGGGSSPEPAASAPTPEPVSLAVTSPIGGSFFATTTVTFSGSTEANGLLSLESATSTATTTADASGNWSVGMVLDEGSPTVIVRATDSAGERATSTSISIFVDVTPPSLPTVSLSQCADSLAADFCLLATTSVSVDWTNVSDASYYALAIDGVTGATTTATSSIAAVGYGATSSISVIAYDVAGNAATSTSQSLYAIERPLIISEIAWAGTDANATDEWIELKNNSPFTLDLSKVSISIDVATSSLGGSLDPNAYYLIEDRAEATSKSHNAVINVDLPDVGAKIALMDTEGNVLDSSPDVSVCSGWCAGSVAATIGTSTQYGNLVAKTSMERTAGDADGALAANWQNNDTYIRTSGSKATDSAAETIYGTPGMENGSGLPAVGWNCGGGILSTAGGSYNPTSSSCTYLSAVVNTRANRYGDVYKGTVASSTLVSGHSLAKSIQSDQNDGSLTSGATAGDQFFVAIYEVRNGPAYSTEVTDFRNYFQTGTGTTPHSNYVTIPWTYAP